MTQQNSSGPLDHAARADNFNKDAARVDWHDETLWFVRAKRDRAVKQLPEWESLREAASTIKLNVLDNLHDYLLEFERQAQANGAVVHWAETAEEHNRIVHKIIVDA